MGDGIFVSPWREIFQRELNILTDVFDQFCLHKNVWKTARIT